MNQGEIPKGFEIDQPNLQPRSELQGESSNNSHNLTSS